jgi:hypothetical protein
MPQGIDITVNRTHRGTIEINDEFDRLMCNRTAEGFYIGLPAKVNLRATTEHVGWHMVRNLRGELYMRHRTDSPIEVGLVQNPGFYIGTPECSTATSLVWIGSPQSLALVEKLRDGRSADFQLWLHGEWCALVEYGASSSRIPTEPTAFHGCAEISYPIEVWTYMLRELHMAENVFVEIPLSIAPPSPWDEVWQALIEARDAFERGGSTGWKGCVTAVRLALERWQGIEKEDMGPGWTSPSRNDRSQRTKRQRLDNLRWHLLQIAHLGAHSAAQDWSRDDALLLLSTLSSLLAERKP